MGKGDKRTKRGKLFRGSHGRTHPGTPPPAPPKPEPKPAPVKARAPRSQSATPNETPPAAE
ncbi:MAG: hypothetical protein BroJett039_10690 [Chloroflexota bacterium]|nr:MAG: hypothetical protein BroJett039_10690 [Chloroflexota bacterium]